MTIQRRTLLRGLTAVPVVGAAAAVTAAASADPVAAAQPGRAAPGALGGAAVPASRVVAAAPEGFPAPNRRIDLYAVELPPAGEAVRIGYGLTPESASYPGPTIQMLEGECIEVTLYNDVSAETLTALRTDEETPIGISLHPHGVRYPHDSDGTVHSGSWVAPGESRTYTWYARPPDPSRGIPGTAGYWWYHDHVVGTTHGTGGLAAGLFGALVVRRRSDPLPDHTYVTAFGDLNAINLRRYPDTDTYDPADPQPSPTSFVARQGETVEFVCIALGSEMHTWHLHGHAWAMTRTGMVSGDAWDDSVQVVDNRTIGPGDSFGFTVIAGELSGPGDWMLHCHLQTHSDLGMSTHFHVLDPDGNPWNAGAPGGMSAPAQGAAAAPVPTVGHSH